MTNEEFEKIRKKYKNVRKEYVITKDELMKLNRKQSKKWGDKLKYEMNDHEKKYWWIDLLGQDPDLIKKDKYKDYNDEDIEYYELDPYDIDPYEIK